MPKILVVSAILFISFLLPLSTQAAIFLQGEDTISPAQPLTDDTYAAGQEIIIEQNINGDFFGAGENIRLGASISEDVFVAGNTLELRGEIQEDAYLAGNEISVFAQEIDDIFAAGNRIKFAPETVVTGDAFIAGQHVELAGEFQGTVRVTGQKITIAPGTHIQGDFLSSSGVEPEIDASATIVGRRQHNSLADTASAPMFNWLYSIVTWFVASLAALYLIPQFTAHVIQISTQRLVPSVVFGVAWLLLFIPVAIMLAITVIGWPFSLMLIVFSLLIVIAALIYGPILFTAALTRRYSPRKNQLTWQHLLLGIVLYHVLLFIPIIGFIAVCLITIWAFGTLVLTVWQRLRLRISTTPTPES